MKREENGVCDRNCVVAKMFFGRRFVHLQVGAVHDILVNVVFHGKVPKRPKGVDSKSTRRRKACVGSNPTLSAISRKPLRCSACSLLYADVGP